MTRLLLASENRNKLREIRSMLECFDVEVVSPSQLGFSMDVEETGETFEENAAIKALYGAKAAGIPAVADDSGLCVAALGGRPGVYSARYAGPGANDTDRISLLLHELEGISDRSAFFICALAFRTPDGGGFTVTGRCDGEIAMSPAGDNGFGYDPVFYCPTFGKTFAQLTESEKASVSHRGMALERFRTAAGEFIEKERKNDKQ